MKQLYRSYEDSIKIFKDYAKKYKNNFKIQSIGKTYEERDIYLITISDDIKTANKKPALFFTGTIHAREWIGHELAIEFSKYVLENLEHDLTLKSIFQKASVYMVACANPDGFEYSRNHFSFWRKNRRLNADGTYGVDLNRNFNVGFVKSLNAMSNIYGGTHSFSELETQALRDFVNKHENITIALDYHSQGNVFFPAHDFRHEDTIDTSDMNILCANMAEEIRKISNREYGIHQGKPPAQLISGSGREFYYSKGIISIVVEVGTRNISDYMDNMSEHLREHIHALLVAIREVPNYQKNSIVKRVDSFESEEIKSSSVLLKWKYKSNDNIFFEIYRSEKNKNFCTEANLIVKTTSLEFLDIDLDSNKDYFYNIRVVNKKTNVKSPFYPQLNIRTNLSYDEFSRTYYAVASKTGYVSEYLTSNKKHFGFNSLFVGVDKNKGITYSIITINLDTMPNDSNIKSCTFYLYPINRVSTTIEKYGEWNVGIVNQETINDISNFEDVHNAEILSYLGRPTESHQLTQGIYRTWELSGLECIQLNKEIKNNQVILRVEGPIELKIGRDKQMMQWDIGYGKYGFGLSYRPRLELTYQTKPEVVTLYAKEVCTLSKDLIDEKNISTGFDKNADKIYTKFVFNLASLPAYDYTMITKAYFILNSTKVYLKDDIRFHLEFIDEGIKNKYKDIAKREVIHEIGFDVSASDLKNDQTQLFMFDSFARIELNKKLKFKEDINFILKPTSSKKTLKDKTISWELENNELCPKLIIEYISKRRFPIEEVQNEMISCENNKIKLSWLNPSHNDLKGVKVIKNAFRAPLSHKDGQKLYAGSDEFTFDEFGAKDVDKYYAIFTYDDVPNYSKAVIIKYSKNTYS